MSTTVLFSSALCSLSQIEYILKKYNKNVSGVTDQKYYRLMVNGLLKNGCNVHCLSAPPISRTNEFIKLKSDSEGQCTYTYINILDVPGIRQISIFFVTLLHLFRWIYKTRSENRFIVCDVLNVSSSAAILLAKLFHIHVIGIMTDMPGLMVNRSKGVVGRLITAINMILLQKYSSYVFLTEEMNVVVNKNKRPYLIMEGIVDYEMNISERLIDKSLKEIMYAGSLYERYGVKDLIDAFREVEGDNLRLLIYGIGPMEKDMPFYMKQDQRLFFMGCVSNKKIVEKELSTYLLINPRPTNEDFVKYSFPSKNMEYMVSGTPLLTTNLPGMPLEYKDYVYIIEKENKEGIKMALDKLLNHTSREELESKGNSAKKFVLAKKNNICQMKRVIDLYESNK